MLYNGLGSWEDAMAFQPAPDIAEAVITYIGHSKEFKNVVHGFKVGGYDLPDLSALAIAVDFAVGLNWLPIQSVDYAYVSTTVRGLAFENDQEVVITTSAGGGVIAGIALPDNVTLSVKKASSQTGRSARGRLYWIGLPASDLEANELKITVVATNAIRDAIDAIRSIIDASVWEAAILSRFTGKVERPFGVHFEWVNTVAVNNNVNSQRRRLLN